MGRTDRSHGVCELCDLEGELAHVQYLKEGFSSEPVLKICQCCIDFNIRNFGESPTYVG